MNPWGPREYLRFSDERTLPSVDLAQQIAVALPSSVIDSGCGPDDSTSAQSKRWNQARVVGLGNSAEMIATADAEHPGHDSLVEGLFGHVVPVRRQHNRMASGRIRRAFQRVPGI